VKEKKPEDVDFMCITDYSPPLATLDALPRAKWLKAEWKNSGPPFVIDQEPDAHRLHEQELTLAKNLRLHCAVYLTSKRRIFQAYVATLRNKDKPKPFRKTDAQQACRIDVNKASKLWSAFEKAGWFDPRYFQKYTEDSA
jgi:hypothetical protein